MKKLCFFLPVCLLFAFFTYASVTEQGISSHFWKIEAAVLALLIIIYAVGSAVRLVSVLSVKGAAEQIYGRKFRAKKLLCAILAPLAKYTYLSDAPGECEVIVVFARRRYAKYHFDSPRTLELYEGNRETYRTGKVRYAIGKNVTRKLKWRTEFPSPGAKAATSCFPARRCT